MRSIVLATSVLTASAFGYLLTPTILDAAVDVESSIIETRAAEQRAAMYAADKIPTLWPITSPIVPRPAASASR